MTEFEGRSPVQKGSTCQSGTQYRVLSIRGRGSGLVSQVPCLGDSIVVVGIKKMMAEFPLLSKNTIIVKLLRICLPEICWNFSSVDCQWLEFHR